MLSDKQQAVLDFIISYKTDHDGVSPSRREIVENCPVKSTSHVSEILKSLQDLGLIRFEPYQSRTIQTTNGKWVYRKDSKEDYQEFLAWYEENETWLECRHTEKEAFYGAWEAGAGEWHEYDGPEEDEG